MGVSAPRAPTDRARSHHREARAQRREAQQHRARVARAVGEEARGDDEERVRGADRLRERDRDLVVAAHRDDEEAARGEVADADLEHRPQEPPRRDGREAHERDEREAVGRRGHELDHRDVEAHAEVQLELGRQVVEVDGGANPHEEQNAIAKRCH